MYIHFRQNFGFANSKKHFRGDYSLYTHGLSHTRPLTLTFCITKWCAYLANFIVTSVKLSSFLIHAFPSSPKNTMDFLWVLPVQIMFHHYTTHNAWWPYWAFWPRWELNLWYRGQWSPASAPRRAWSPACNILQLQLLTAHMPTETKAAWAG